MFLCALIQPCYRWHGCWTWSVLYLTGMMLRFVKVILFSDAERMDAEHLVTKLDKDYPNGMFTHLLWKGDMRTIDGQLVKDVSRLNRNPGRVVVVDDNALQVAAQPENLLQVHAAITTHLKFLSDCCCLTLNPNPEP